MNGKLRTVAVFYEPTQAHISRNRLAAEGIKAFLSNETVVANDWAIGQAVGHIQLQVQEVDYELASSTLNEKSEVSEEELTELAINADSEVSAKPIFSMFYPEETWEEGAKSTSSNESLENTNPNDQDELEIEPNPREVLVERAFRAAILSLCIAYLSPLATWLIIDAACHEAPLGTSYKKKLAWSVAIHIPALILMVFLLRMHLGM